ncbi:MAG: hypothetical protein ACI4GW_06535 [Lachnospiraceae bacterium]
MKIRNKLIFVVIAAVLVSGYVSGEEESAVTEDAGNAADTLETVEDNPAGEEAESVETSLEETENAQFIYEMNENFIGNFNDVFSENEVF